MAPVVLTIAGSDSGGGAGIQADLKTFEHFRTYGTSAITCLTAQNPGEVSGIFPADPEFVALQIKAVMSWFDVKAVKTGMLYSAEIIRAVSGALSGFNGQIVIDPVMVATSGAKLLQDEAISELTGTLFPVAGLITPNLAEAELLLNSKITAAEMKPAAEELADKFRCAVLLKGGHLEGTTALDILTEGKKTTEFSSPFIKGINTHGTGCTYASAVTANLALELPLTDAVSVSKKYLYEALANGIDTGHGIFLNHSLKQ